MTWWKSTTGKYIQSSSGHFTPGPAWSRSGPPTKKPALNLQSLMSSIMRGQQSSQAANLLRYDQIMGIYDDLIARNVSGGAFQKAGEARISKAAKKGVGQELSRLVGSGLASTTEFGAAGRRWEADVSAPARLDLQSIMEEKETALRLGKAGAIERREDVGPDLGLLTSLLSRA